MKLKEFDFDYPYEKNEEYIQKLMEKGKKERISIIRNETKWILLCTVFGKFEVDRWRNSVLGSKKRRRRIGDKHKYRKC